MTEIGAVVAAAAGKGSPLPTRSLSLKLLLLSAAAGIVQAHSGPPVPIIKDQPFGSCRISLWAHADVGLAPFSVVVAPLGCTSQQGDFRFDIAVEPVSARLPVAVYHAEPQPLNDGLQYSAGIPFDKEEMWRVYLYAKTNSSEKHWTTDVQVNSAGLGAWDFLFFSVPFISIGLLSAAAVQRKRRRTASEPANAV